MTRIAIPLGGASLLARDPMLLPDTASVIARNLAPLRGDLRPLRAGEPVASVPADRQTIYRMGDETPSRALHWLSWPAEVSVVPGADPLDTSELTLFSGSGTPKWVDNTFALASAPYPAATRELAVPRPSSAAVVARTATGAGDEETRFFTYTWVNERGWESAPAPTTSFVMRPDDAVTVSGFASVPAGNYGINRRRLWVSQTGTSGGTEFFLHSEQAIGTAAHVVAANASLQADALETTGWLPPPADLHHLTAVAAGMLVGLVGKTIRACEPGAFYAWPPQFERALPNKPLAVAVWRENVLALTTGAPVLMMGGDPESLMASDAPIPLNQGLASTRSVVSFSHGAAWASEDGLCYVGDTANAIVTEGIILPRDWAAMNPASIIGVQWERYYLGSYDDGTGRKGFLIDPRAPDGIYFHDIGFDAAWYDKRLATTFVKVGTQVLEWDAAATKLTATWRSKEFRLTMPANLGCVEVTMREGPATVRVWADGVLRDTRTLTASGQYGIPSGFTADFWQVEVETTGAVQGVVLAESFEELSQV